MYDPKMLLYDFIEVEKYANRMSIGEILTNVILSRINITCLLNME